MGSDGYPRRIVCLTDETTETLYLLGEGERVVGVSGPRVFFEEWDSPLISGIRWVDELIETAGGEPIYPELRAGRLAKARIVDPESVAARDPELVVASWCGRSVRKRTIRDRDGWQNVSAVRSGHLYEIKSAYILQPGPAALTEGVRQLHALIGRVVGVKPDPRVIPRERLDPDAVIGS